MAARKYTKIQFEDIQSELMSILKAKGGPLADLSDSSYGRILLDLFAGTADLMAYYAESSFQNAFLETATNLGSIYAGGRMLGYNPRRPVPAKAGIGIQTTTTGQFDTIRVFIPKGTEFALSGLTLTALSDMEFSYDRNLDENRTGLMTLASGYAVLAEGVSKTVNFVSSGAQNQTFIINDPTFSDYFGENDPNYADDGNVSHRESGFTVVTSDATLVDGVDLESVMNDRLFWRISRRGFTDPAKDSSSNDLSSFVPGEGSYTTNYTVQLNTANDGNVQMKFSDGLKSAIPYGIISVKYFSTHGENGNLTNVSGSVLATSSTSITIRQADGSESDITINDLNIALTTDISGGQSIESPESIRNNSPEIYNTLDHLITGPSYSVFLRRYADIKYAVAFGEDILNTKLRNGGINVKYMNQVRFSALKNLYRERDGSFYPTSSDEYFLSGFKVNGLMYTWEYDFQDVDITGNAWFGERRSIIENLRSKLVSDFRNNTVGGFSVDSSSDPEGYADRFISEYLGSLIPEYPLDYKVFNANVGPMDFVEPGSELHSIMVALNRRGMLTVGGGFHSYVYPSVHTLSLSMDVTLFKGNKFTDIRDRIKNTVYKYLKDNTAFSTPIYRSRIASLVHQMVEVAGVDVHFTPVDDGFSNLDIANLPWLGELTYEYITPDSVDVDGNDFSLQYRYITGTSTTQVTDTFKLRKQTGSMEGGSMQDRIRTFYEDNVATKLNAGRLTDKTVDSFVAYIWEQLMQEIYTPIVEAMDSARASGAVAVAGRLYDMIVAIKGWSMEANSLVFKDTERIVGMTEINGSGLYSYMRYGMEYIKLVRNVLEYYVSSSLIDDNGNITNYSNRNEIVQVLIPTEAISLSVDYNTSLKTSMDA